MADLPQTALNVNELVAPVNQDEGKEEAFAVLKDAIHAYMTLIEGLKQDAQAVSEAQIENSYAMLQEAHTTYLAASGLAMKPV